MFVGDVDLPKVKRAPSSSIAAMKVTTVAAVYYVPVAAVVECIVDSVAASVAMELIPTTTGIGATASIQ